MKSSAGFQMRSRSGSFAPSLLQSYWAFIFLKLFGVGSSSFYVETYECGKSTKRMNFYSLQVCESER